MTAPCSATWTDHVLPITHHCGADEGHPGPHHCAACTQLPAGRVDAGNRVGGDGAARPELVTAECGPFWVHEDCDDPGCTCGCHRQESGGSERSDSEPEGADDCPACDTPLDRCSRDDVCCEDCNHASCWPPESSDSGSAS